MMKSRMYLVFLVACMLTFGTTACSDSASQDKSNNGADAGDHSDVTESADTAETVEVPQDWAYASEYSLRFTSLVLTEDSPRASLLNGVLKDNIENQAQDYPVVVLLHLKNIDAQTGTLDLRGGAGVKVKLDCLPKLDGECEYKWDADSEATYASGSTIDVDTGELDAQLDKLNFVATFESGGKLLKSIIPITDLTMTGKLVPTARRNDAGEVVVDVSIHEAHLEGDITSEGAKNSKIQLSPGSEPLVLYKLLGEGTMNVDLDGDSVLDGWHLVGSFSAIETTIVSD